MEFFISPDTDIYLSCSARLNGEYFVFGGATYGGADNSGFTKQIRKINDCRLKRVGDLPIDFTYGACGTSNDLIQIPDNSPDQHGILRETAMSHWHNQHTSS